MPQYDVIVIGAGQAGLAVGYYLLKTGKSFVLLDKGSEVGHIWKSRYDSLVLFTPRFYSSLPGMPLDGDPNGYASKDEIARYLKAYANHFELPIQLDVEVTALKKSGNDFELETNQGLYKATNVIVAIGPFQKPLIPRLAEQANPNIVQVHTAFYRNPSSLQDGPVLVVGAGNSGAQIAVELAKEREVYLSVGHRMKFMPLHLMKKSIFWWFAKIGILKADNLSAIGKRLSRQPDPIFGFELKEAISNGTVRLKPRTVRIVRDVILFSDQTSLKVDNIVWATGFYPDYGWIQIPHSLNEEGKPLHQRGVSTIAGLYFVGMPWQHRRGSALIGGVGQDAEYVVQQMQSIQITSSSPA
ncbi:oxidoreductase [Cohnella sp. CIP 111063]|uniref:flavin-containing monooxygenase n=1 Tax=unclassified Cohnella TaxID=2636738 RepID=UPI000B8BD84E|nr:MULTISPECIES: NAD(P)/FAD-dependent oxidoreductase [unclassified Cohnella]OXS54926.1 oxidoreductase [Cohnella sp. CIP 111063]PRX65072.1 putative flavoprotein involved in K+ transport [Cohnella sp. SGD-V74]